MIPDGFAAYTWVLVIPAALVLLLLCVQLVAWSRYSGPPEVREGFVTGVVGRMGQGKSLYAMTVCRRHLANGGHVISNFRIDTSTTGGDWQEFRGWLELLTQLVERLEHAERDDAGRPKVQPAYVVLDEAHLYAPASGQVLPEIARYTLSHLRKLRAEMVWLTQHEARVATGLRDQTSEMVRVKRHPYFKRSFRAAVFEPEEMRRPRPEPMFTIGYRLSPKVFRMYRSWDLISPDEHGDTAGQLRALVERVRALDHPRCIDDIRNEMPAVTNAVDGPASLAPALNGVRMRTAGSDELPTVPTAECDSASCTT